MSRTNKKGLDYFPFDIDFFNDEKIQFISARFGMKGEAVAVRLLCKIYRNGYYTEFNDDTALLFAKGAGDNCSSTLVKDVVYELLKRGFFNGSIFERFGILTSKGIQNRYFEATKRYKQVYVIREFLLVDVSEMENVNINPINVNINPINVDINPQKEKEKKRKEIEYSGEYSLSGGKPPDESFTDNPVSISCESNAQPERIDYEKLVKWFNETTKGVFGTIKTPLSDKRKGMLRARISEHGKESFVEVVRDALASDFLRGQNQRGWTATFDWLIKPTNYEKVLSKNYRTKEDIESEKKTRTIVVC
jgi:hypothetical protein